MSMDCETLGALLSERRRGELSAEQARMLEDHLAGCTGCRAEAEALESLLAMVELPPIGAVELDALRARRIGETPRRMPARAGWPIPAVLVVAAAAAVLTVGIRPAPRRHGAPAVQTETAVAPPGEVLPAGDTQELFPEMAADPTDESLDPVEDDVQSLEGPGLFGNLDG